MNRSEVRQPKELKPCPNCGAPGRVRYRIPVFWVECKKKCGAQTGYFPDWEEQCDPASKEKAINAWNERKLFK